MKRFSVRHFLFLSLSTFLVGIVVNFWNESSQSILSGLNKSSYSEAKFEGVHLSKYQDLKGVSGTLNQRHEYAKYLGLATQKISTDNGVKTFFSYNKNLSESFSVGRNVSELTVSPKVNDEVFLGIGLVKEFLVSGLSKDVDLQPLVGQMVVLESASDPRNFIGVLEDFEGDVLSIKIDLPVNFFPDSIRFNSSSGRGISYSMMIESNQLGWVRGGVFTSDFSGSTIMLRYPPLVLSKLQIIETGDEIILPDNRHLTVEKSFRIGDKFLVKFKGQFRPYKDSRKNLVTIKKAVKPPLHELILNINKVTNKQYILGKERFLKVLLSDSVSDLTGKHIYYRSYINNRDKSFIDVAPLFVSSHQDNIIKIDLLKSYFLSSCASQNEGQLGKMEWFKAVTQSCSIEKNTSLENLPKNESFIYRVINDVNNMSVYNGLDINNIWEKSGELNFFYISDVAFSRVNKTQDVKKNQAPPSDFRIWEIYPGSLLNVFYSTLNPAPIEMMIHVLSPEERRSYYQAFKHKSPKYVSFAKPERFYLWLLNWHWPFFQHLLLEYDEVVKTNEFSLWKKKSNPMTQSSEWRDLEEQFPIQLSVPSKQHKCELKLAEVELEYELDNPMSMIPVVGKSPRQFIYIDGNGLPSNMPVSLPWNKSKFSFPVFYREGTVPEMHLKTEADPFQMSNIKIKKIRQRNVETPAGDLENLYFDHIGTRANFNDNCLGHK